MRPDVILRGACPRHRSGVAESTLDSATRPGGLVRNDGGVVILRAHLVILRAPMSFCAQSQNLSMDSAMVAGATPQNDVFLSFCAPTLSFCASVAQSQNLLVRGAMRDPPNMSFCAQVAESTYRGL